MLLQLNKFNNQIKKLLLIVLMINNYINLEHS